MSKTTFRIKFISLLIIFSFILTFTTSSVVAALADEKVEISLSAAAPRKAVALIPSYDYPSVTINSHNPVNIEWRSTENILINEFDIESSANASYEYPFHIKRVFSPLTSQNTIDYGQTSWLIFNSTSTESHGDYTISTNNSAQAIDDNGEETFLVQPDNHFHLRIAVGAVGPVSVRLNFFPDKFPQANYVNYNLFDPNGAIIEPYTFSDGGDEYLCFIAEKKGYHSLIFHPIDQPHFYNIQCKTYKPQTLKIENPVEPTIVGIPDSELTDELKENNPLTFDWYKFNPTEGQTTRIYFENLRGIVPGSQTYLFVPGFNNTVGIDSLDNIEVTTCFENKRPNYILTHHAGTARYLIGVEELESQAIEKETYVYTKLAADLFKQYTFSVSSISSLRVDLFSENANARMVNIINTDGFSAITKGFYDSASEYRAYNFVAMPGEYLLIVRNHANQEVWMNLRVALNNLEEPINFKNWEDMTGDPNLVNLDTDTDMYELDVTDIPYITKSKLFNIKSTFADERLSWKVFFGAQYDDNNDLVASHTGENIDVNTRISIFMEVKGRIILIVSQDFIADIASFDNDKSITIDIDPYRAISSETGNYWISIDSFMKNGTNSYLPYENFLRLGVYDVQDFYYSTGHEANFTANEASFNNIKINTTRYPNGAIVKVPSAGYNWTDVEVHTLNGTMTNGMKMFVDIPNILSSTDENASLVFNLKEDPSLVTPDQLGNYTFGYGAPTNQDYIYLALLLDHSDGREIVTFNLTLQRLSTSVLDLEKETKVKPGGGAPGFEWLLSIFGLGTTVHLVTQKRKRK